MPATFHPATHEPAALQTGVGDSTPLVLLNKLLKALVTEERLFQSSIRKDTLYHALNNGLVNTLLLAYNQHHAVVIRPDDVWISILTQFSFFVNGNAENLRSYFVDHEGQEEIKVVVPHDRHSIDFGSVANVMTTKLGERLKDPSLLAWVRPDFTTTTDADVAVSSVLLMSSMKSYFTYTMYTLCGIPSVTLDGQKEDWEDLLARTDRLLEFKNDELTAWHRLLTPVLSRFVRAFDNPQEKSNIDFWQRVAQVESNGSGTRYLSGWITAFCVFDEKGNWIGNPISTEEAGGKMKEILSHLNPTPTSQPKHYIPSWIKPVLTLDNVTYHILDTQKIPPGYSQVDVKYIDDGKTYDTIMVAGGIGCEVADLEMSNGKVKERALLKMTTGWWMYEKADSDEKREPFGW
ncbi:hypothetical protein DL96DRAFT_1648675 [Flagelloscypha sp. PMI_526]|nr:hypothetical protein DL96DRAFT_1648675 [Flagelloscypha sp. PMI_526]